MRTERWSFTNRELKHPKTCRADDEFMVLLDEEESELPVIVYRNGEVSNRYADGTVGVIESNRLAANDQETLYTLDGEDSTFEWRDVEVTDEGEFVRFFPVGITPPAIREEVQS